MHVNRYAEADLPTRLGSFRVCVYREHGAADHGRVEEHVAIVRGQVSQGRGVLCRVQRECWTSQVLGALECDCRGQFDRALQKIGTEGIGVLIQLRHLRLGSESCRMLTDAAPDALAETERQSCEVAAAILDDLGIESVRILTNSPTEVDRLREADVIVTERLAHSTAEDAQTGSPAPLCEGSIGS
jgi:GTP cyclohydrolase II